MRRRLLFATLVLLVASMTAAGCGSQGVQRAGSGEAPEPAELAAEAVAAFDEVESARYVLAVEGRVSGGEGGDFAFQAQGGVSDDVFTADGSVRFPGGNFSGQVLVGEHEAFINFLGTWYGMTDFGLADARQELEQASAEDAGAWWAMSTPEGVRLLFPQVFVGEASAGPEVEGKATWRFEGSLNVAGILGLSEQYGKREASERERELLAGVAESVQVTMLFGREDRLLHLVEVHADLSEDEFGLESGPLDAERLEVDLTLELSRFGEPVDYDAPEEYEPLERLFESLFSGLG